MSDSNVASALVPSPRELLTEDEQDRARAFGIPPLLLLASRGNAAPHGYFQAAIRDLPDRFDFDRCVICADHVWVTLIGQAVNGVDVHSNQVLEVRIADVHVVFAQGMFVIQPNGIQQDNGIRLTPPTVVQGEITNDQMQQMLSAR